MAASMLSTPAVALFTSLKSDAAFPITHKAVDITSINNSGGRVQCMKKGFGYREDNKSPGYTTTDVTGIKWKLPIFGCTDSSQVIKELEELKKEYPNAFARIIGFDNKRKVQCVSFIAYKPRGY